MRGLEGKGGADPTRGIDLQMDVDTTKARRVEFQVKPGDPIIQLAGGLDGEGGDRFRG
jgi:hypothetical protein